MAGFLFACSGYRLLGRDEEVRDCALSSMAAARRELFRRSIAWLSPMYNAPETVATGAAAVRLRRRKPAGVCVLACVLPCIFHGKTGPTRRDVRIDHLVIAGWTGRDKAALEKHIAELEAIGVKRPATTPIFYRASAARLTTGDAIEALGNASSGEAEFILLRHGGRLWVGAGSDHTDREVEKYGVSVSKQMCDKPIAPEFWDYAEVAPHWDRLMLRAHISENGARTLYQEGSVAAMLDPLALIEQFAGKAGLAENTLMFCGTLAARGGVRPSDEFAFELDDPVLGAQDSPSLPGARLAGARMKERRQHHADEQAASRVPQDRHE